MWCIVFIRCSNKFLANCLSDCILMLRHVENDARFHLRWKDGGDSSWLVWWNLGKSLEISTHLCVERKKNASVLFCNCQNELVSVKSNSLHSVCCSLLIHARFPIKHRTSETSQVCGQMAWVTGTHTGVSFSHANPINCCIFSLLNT